MNISQETDDLLGQIIDEKDKVLFTEAIGCLVQGFYRTGYIAAWIGIVESLKRKVITLSEIGDKAAQAAVERISDEEAVNHSVDVMLVKYSKELSLIEDSEFPTLQFFWSQRCLFAHPYENAPKASELLFILQQSVKLVLGVPIFYKKSFIETYITNLNDKAHFLPDDPSVIKKHIGQILPRIANGSKPVLFHHLYAGLGEQIDNPDRQKYQRRTQIWLIEFIKHLEGRLDQTQWKLEDKAIRFPQTGVYAFLDMEVYSLMPVRIIELLLEFACDDKDGNHHHFARQQFSERILEGKVTETHCKRFQEFLNDQSFSKVHYYYKDPNLFADRIIREIRSGDFYKQEPAVNALQNPENTIILQATDHDKLIEIGRQVHHAAILNSFASQAFMRSESIAQNDNILIGAFETNFIYNKSLHLRYEYFSNLLFQLSSKDSSLIEQLINNLLPKITTSEISSVYNLDYMRKTLENLFEGNQVNKTFVDKLNPVWNILRERKQKYDQAFI